MNKIVATCLAGLFYSLAFSVGVAGGLFEWDNRLHPIESCSTFFGSHNAIEDGNMKELRQLTRVKLESKKKKVRMESGGSFLTPDEHL